MSDPSGMKFQVRSASQTHLASGRVEEEAVVSSVSKPKEAEAVEVWGVWRHSSLLGVMRLVLSAKHVASVMWTEMRV